MNSTIATIIKQFPTSILSVLLDETKEYVCSFGNSITRQQETTMRNLAIPESKKLEPNENKRVLSWESSNHLTLYFREDFSFQCIYRDVHLVPNSYKFYYTFQHLLENKKIEELQRILSIENELQNYAVQNMQNYSNQSHNQLLILLKELMQTKEVVNEPNEKLDNFIS